MKKNVNLVDFSDLLHYSEKIGYFWNQAHDILVKDNVVPMCETTTLDYYFSDYVNSENYEQYSASADTVKILVGFMVSENIEHFTLTAD